MPRLRGRRSPTGLSLLIPLIVVAGVLSLEYFGITNFMSNYDRQNRLKQPIAADDAIDKIDTINK